MMAMPALVRRRLRARVNLADRGIDRRVHEETDVVALVAAGEKDVLGRAHGRHHVRTARGGAVGDDERRHRVDAVHGLQIVVVPIRAGSAQHDDVHLGVAIAAAADAVDDFLIRGIDVSASAREMKDRAVEGRHDVGRVPGVEARQRRLQREREKKKGEEPKPLTLSRKMRTNQNRTRAPKRHTRGLCNCSIQLLSSVSGPLAEYIRLSRHRTVRSLLTLNRSTERFRIAP